MEDGEGSRCANIGLVLFMECPNQRYLSVRAIYIREYPLLRHHVTPDFRLVQISPTVVPDMDGYR